MTTFRNPMSILKVAAFGEGLATAMLLFFVPFYVRSRLNESSFAMISLIISLPATAVVLAGNFWGALADITGRYVAITSLCLVGFSIALALVPLMDGTTTMIALVTGLSLVYGAVRPMLLAHATLLKEKSKPGAISSIFLYESLGWFFSGMFFGLVFLPEKAWTTWLVFYVPAVLCLVTALILLIKGKDPEIRNNSFSSKRSFKARFVASLIGDLSEIYSNNRLRRLLCVVLVSSTANFCFFGMDSVFYTEVANGSTKYMGITISISTLIGVFVFNKAGRSVESRGGRLVLKATIVAWCVVYSLFCLVRNPYLASLLFLLPVYPFFLVSITAIAADASRSKQRGGGLGVLTGVSAISTILGSTLGGATADLVDLNAVPGVSAIVGALAFVVFLFLMSAPENQQEDPP